MSNPNPLPKQAKHGKELAQRTRAGILNAFDAVERRGQLISEALADAFLADPLKFMDTAAKYLPKGNNQPTQHITNALQLTDDQLIQVIQARQSSEKQVKGQVVDTDHAQLVNNHTEEHY